MGVPDYKINSSIRAILAQRLVRKVCPHCSIRRPITNEESKVTGISMGTNIRQSTSFSGDEREKRKKEGTLCKICNGTGYNGRIGTYEFLPITREVQVALREKKSEKEIESIAIDSGMLTLESYGFELVKAELTTIKEVIRVCKN